MIGREQCDPACCLHVWTMVFRPLLKLWHRIALLAALYGNQANFVPLDTPFLDGEKRITVI